MPKKYFLIAGIIWVLLAGSGLYLYNKPHTNTAGMSADLDIDAADLYNQYQKDESAANKKFLDKIVRVKGKVSDVSQSGNMTSIQLDAGAPAGGINCNITGSKNLPLPAKGSALVIKGRCSGFLMDVNLVDCVIDQ